MLNGVLLLSALTVTISLSPSNTESRKTSASRDICRSRCACEERESLLNINCENKEFTTVGQFQAPPNKISQLFLNGNFLSRLAANEFVNYGNVTSLHLGNNGLQEIRTGAFNGLRFLKRLHLNNNNLEVIKEDMFAGLESLEYLQADYNYISAVEPGAFSKLNKLKVLILNDNLLPSLPANVFRFVLLTHLDLRGNRLKTLPFAGVLEHIGGIMEIQLEENPWNCTCDLVPLKAWLDTISVFVGDIVCETPFRLHGKDVTQLIRQDLCPRRNAGERNAASPPHHHQHHPPNDSHYGAGVAVPAASTVHPGSAGVVPTRSPKASRPPKMRHRPTPRVTSKDKHVFGPIMVYQTRSPVPVLCPNVCVCTSQNPDSGLNVNCQERKLNNITELSPRPSYPKKLHLTGNYLQVIYRADLAEYSSLELLHLGNNRIAAIQEGAFENLTNLRRLYLNGNYIESLSRSLFAGLQSLQYLYLEYNVIKEILPQTFSALHNLQLLFLNNNLLRSLPDQVFGGTMLTRLNLRNNHFSYLPVRGVLDQLSAFIQIDLQENPWDCTCHIVALKNWMELSSTSVVVNEITCDSPSKHAGRLLRSLRNEAICPEGEEPPSAPPPQRRPPTKQPTLPPPGPGMGGAAHSSSSSSTAPSGAPSTSSSSSSSTTPSSPSSTAASSVSSLSLGPSAAAPPTTESRVLSSPPELHPEVPLSVLILGLLVVFILSVCLGAGLFVFVLKRRKGVEHVLDPAGVGVANSLDLSSFQVQYGSYAAEPTAHRHADKAAAAGESHVYNYIPPPVGSMCQNPIYMQKDHQEQVAFYRNLKELSFGALDPKKDELLGGRSPGGRGAYTISAADFMDKSPCGPLEQHPPPELLYQNFTERPNREILPAAAGAPPSYNYNFCTLPKRPCVVPPYEAVAASARRHLAVGNSGGGQDRPLNKTTLYGTPRKYYGAEQPSSKTNDHPLLLPGKLKAEPDYLEVLEKQTAVSQL